jgi:hypothetical protein
MIRLQALGWAAVVLAIAACQSTTGANETTTTGASVQRGDAAAAPDYSPMEPAPASIDTQPMSIDTPPMSIGRPVSMADAAVIATPAFQGTSFGNDPPASSFQGSSFGNDNTAPPR